MIYGELQKVKVFNLLVLNKIKGDTMKIAIFEVEKWEQEYISSKVKEHDLVFSDGELDEESVDKVSDADVVVNFIESKVNKKVISKFRKLKAVITMSTGYDHIDIKACKKRNIAVYNVPRYGENTVAEHAFALILALAKNLYKSINLTKLGKFSTEELQGIDLKGKTIGIVGMGSIGSHVARMAKGFEMNVLAFNRSKDKKLAKRLGFKYVKTLDELLKNSDIVTLHLPLNKFTYHIINKKNILLMKPGSFLINTARGDLVDSAAIILALDKGILKGAGLDVLEEEELLKEERQLYSKKFSRQDFINLMENTELMKRDNVLITPHNAFNTKNALQRILDTTIKNIKSATTKSKKKVVERVV